MGTTRPSEQLPTASSVLIAQLARGMRRRFEDAVAPLGLRPRQLLALNHLRVRGPCPQQTMIDLLGVDASNVVGVLNDLEDAGLIVRRRDRADRRRGIIEIAPPAVQLLDELDRALERVDDDVLSALTSEERALLHALLTRATAGLVVDCAEPTDEAC